MSYLLTALDFFLHLDKHLAEIVSAYGGWTYGILFVIVFCETGLVITPFLPGDSLLFAAGAIASRGNLDVTSLALVLAAAAIIGDSVNYQIGKFIGPKVFQEKYQRVLKREYLERTQRFFEKHGGKAIVLARFVPIIRTFAPFLAGVGKMNYFYFVAYNIVGGLCWVFAFVFGGYFFSELPVVKNNFTIVIVAIVVLSLLPAVVEVLKARAETRKQSA